MVLTIKGISMRTSPVIVSRSRRGLLLFASTSILFKITNLFPKCMSKRTSIWGVNNTRVALEFKTMRYNEQKNATSYIDQNDKLYFCCDLHKN